MFTFILPQKSLNYSFEILGSFVDYDRSTALKKTISEFNSGASTHAYGIRLYLRSTTDRINAGDIVKVGREVYKVLRVKSRIMKLESLCYVDLNNKGIQEVYRVGDYVDLSVLNSVYELEELN